MITKAFVDPETITQPENVDAYKMRA